MTQQGSHQNYSFHVRELRFRSLFCIIAFAIYFTIFYSIAEVILATFFNQISKHLEITLHFFQVTDGIHIRIKIAFWTAIFAVYPLISYHTSRFLYPAYPSISATKVTLYATLSTLTAVTISALFSHHLIQIFLGFSHSNVQTTLAALSALSFYINTALVLQLLLHIPLILSSLIKHEIITPNAVKKYRRIFYIGAFIMGGILTPPDPVTQILVASCIILPTEILLKIRMKRLQPKHRNY